MNNHVCKSKIHNFANLRNILNKTNRHPHSEKAFFQCSVALVSMTCLFCAEESDSVSLPPPPHQKKKYEKMIFAFHLWISLLRIRIRDPGSGIRYPVLFWPLDPGSGIRNRFFPDPGFRIPDPKLIFLRAWWQFIEQKFYNSLKIGPNFFLQHFKNKIMFNYVNFVTTKKGMTTNFFHPSLLLLFLDPGSKIRDPGWVKIRIRDPG